MARKTFISYKYSDARDVRDRIIRALGSDATYYRGEDGYSQDLSGYKADTIKDVKRKDRCSRSNGIVAVIKEVNGGYSWLRRDTVQADGHRTHNFIESKIPKIISDNRCNQEPKEYACSCCKSIDWLEGSYISIISEDEFISNPNRFIENAYEKSQRLENYRLTKRVGQ